MVKSFFLLTFLLFVVACSKAPVADQPRAIRKPPATETDHLQRKKFKEELALLLEKENFDDLERIAHKITTEKDRFPGGDWKLERFYGAIGYTPTGNKQPDRTDYRKRIAKLRKWTEQKPDSIYANVALAEAQTGYAWQLRGSGFAHTVSD